LTCINAQAGAISIFVACLGGVFVVLGLPHQAIADFSGGLDLLLMRMEALHLDLGDVKRLEITVSRDLVAACTNCESKDRGEHDFGVRVGRTILENWEKDCPNAAILNAMKELPCFWGRLAKRALIGRDVE
jgi:hypothetical protein